MIKMFLTYQKKMIKMFLLEEKDGTKTREEQIGNVC